MILSHSHQFLLIHRHLRLTDRCLLLSVSLKIISLSYKQHTELEETDQSALRFKLLIIIESSFIVSLYRFR